MERATSPTRRRAWTASRSATDSRFAWAEQRTTMRASTDRIMTTHVGALPIPPGLWSKEGVGEARLRREVAEIVRLQREAGVDIVNEGELTKGGTWGSFTNPRLSRFVPGDHRAIAAPL